MRLTEDQMAAIALSAIPGLGPARLNALRMYFGSVARALRASATQLQRVRGIGRSLAEQIQSFDARNELRRQYELARRVSAKVLTIEEASYPALLREIYDPPPFLWTRGSGTGSTRHMIAIVGSRRATQYGLQIAFDLSAGLASAGFTIVSGMAYGIDAAAHEGALSVGGCTAAVLGCGVDIVYPGSNRALFERIISTGAVYSEFPMGARPEPTNFPRRNRLISGMSKGVVVVEAYEQGGGLITARFALDQNREVFCVPGLVTSPASKGSNRMIRDGEAKLITSVEDVTDEVDPPGGTNVVRRVPEPTLSSVEEMLLRVIDMSGSDLDTICSCSGLGPADAAAGLLSLEMRGLVRQAACGVFHAASRSVV